MHPTAAPFMTYLNNIFRWCICIYVYIQELPVKIRTDANHANN